MSKNENARLGLVWLVGAGPGDADLLTLRALRAIERADIILYDQLVGEDIKSLFPASTPAMYVGKLKGNHSMPQQALNELMIEKALEGLKVCRIKGGDPFVFGRGGEELAELKAAGIQAEVVPGITAASGATSYAGIPLTHRGLSQGCTFVTAHGEKDLKLNWSSLAGLDHTLVFYMGVSKSGLIMQNLIESGMSQSKPVAIIENGCRANQRVITGELSHLQKLVSENDVKSPALIVVGEVVSLHKTLSPQQTHLLWEQFTKECERINA